jgi:Fe-S cluster assembly iron-binding protein IscA
MQTGNDAMATSLTLDSAAPNSVALTARAARRIGEILKTEPPGSMLRVSVEGGGCSGFQYKFDFVRAKTDDDLVLAGAEIDFVDDLIGASFRISNPVATASCGCGTSFSV